MREQEHHGKVWRRLLSVSLWYQIVENNFTGVVTSRLDAATLPFAREAPRRGMSALGIHARRRVLHCGFGSLFFCQTLEIKPLTHVRPLTFFSSSPANKRVIQSGTRNLPRSTHAEFGKHVCLNPLGDYGTKSRPDPAWKPGVSKLSLWAGCEVRVMGLKTVWTVASQLATAYQRIPLGSHWINRPPRLINWNQWMRCQEEEEERKSSPVRWRVG